MSIVTINEQVFNLKLSDYKTFADIMEAVYKKVNEVSHFIVNIELNSQVLTQEEELKIQDMPVSEIKSLGISTANQDDIVAKTVNDLLLFLNELMKATKKVAQNFRNSTEEEANKEFNDYLEELELFNTALDKLISFLKSKGQGHLFKNELIVSLKVKLLELTKQMVDSQSTRDWVMLADLIEFELTAIIKEWEEFLNVVKTMIKPNQ